MYNLMQAHAGMAQMWGNLGNVYAQKDEWDRATEVYRCSLQITERMGDWLTLAYQYTNPGFERQPLGQPRPDRQLTRARNRHPVGAILPG